MKALSASGTSTALTTILAPIAWGTTYITITEFLPDDRPLFVAASRVLPASLVLLGVGVLHHRPNPRTMDWRQLATLSLFNFGMFFPLLIVAIYRLPGGVAAAVGGLQPLFVALAGYIVSGVKPKRLDLAIGMVAALGVTMVVVSPGAQIDPIGVLAAVGANISFSIGVVLTRRYAAKEDRLTRTGIQLLLSAIVIVPMALIIEGAPEPMTLSNIVGLGYLSLLATGAAFVVWFNGIPRLPPQAPPVLGLAAPVTGAALGWVVLGEALSPIQLAGFAVTIGAIVYAATAGSKESPIQLVQAKQPSTLIAATLTSSDQPGQLSQ